MRFSSRLFAPLALMLGVFVLLPLAAVRFVPPAAGMMAMMFLFYFVNPLCSILIGFFAGKHARLPWILPILSAILFWLTAQYLFGPDTAFLFYAGAYLLLGLLTMLCARYIFQKRTQP
ncbi:MAG: hypothetical protein ACOYIE_03970 [Agathobaculum sp.]|jgi:hypothetical protein|uniref:hypothetical protein n=1 Tax=Agathobaculum sp. TaxID=2048138 RepID=UPI003D8A2C21